MAIAVAGTGGVGRTILETLVQDPKYQNQIIVLTRTVKSDSLLDQVQQLQIDYDDISSVSAQLEQHGVHTTISAIGIVSEETSQSQLNLIQAADKSTVTRRFIPSEYSFIQTEDLLPIDSSIKFWLDAAAALKKSSLQYTRVVPGFFMDYWGMPNVRTNIDPLTFGINIAKGQAAIPGDGNDVISMTYTYDMAKVLVRALDLEEWPEFSVIVGQDVTYNQLLRWAEEIRGKKFQVVYDSADKINQNQVTVPPMPDGIGYSEEEIQEMTALVSRLTVAGAFKLPVENRLNARFPGINLVSVKEFLTNAWK
ncbi:hypothetical protein ASPWEDRAFT_72512 [Aspergillus wentii DTO 134E9]|uniref:NAD(P)-binding domain-containing protein n=1 Tax=Aspergillus wentii DTO 134E9 TaxID=1073089 RepID=A0A1L9R9L6_ASPWE|nr:uncharacterized protein ASPWEDRAFT_72512 [Aspergillus wentii DTO 134E9]OJJ31616.1 hypothetical protein ASPWEDRAFT_72512 [Aspergillus wentii DTO 134E9]